MIKSWKQLSDLCRDKVQSEKLISRQEKWLFDCLKRNSVSDYGKRYCFGQIKTVLDFKRQLPIVSYKDISNSIADIAKGKSNSLYLGNTIAFERTSGSTNKQKLIPYSEESIIDFRNAILPWLSSLVAQYGISSGKAYWAISPATRQPEVTESGIPIGLPDVAYLGEDLIPFFLESSVIPRWITQIQDVDDWQLVTLYFLVCCRDLHLISVWSPTFLLMLIDAIDDRRKDLETALRQGTKKHRHYLSANKSAYSKLMKYFASRDLCALWPELKVISCWSDASSSIYAEKLKKLFPGVPIQPKGLLLTEGSVTVPNKNNLPVLTADSGFYEFLDSNNNILLAHQLTTGGKYEVIMTTSGGLYRYKTNDCVRCDGHSYGLPVLRFIGRGSTCDLAGEKLTEEFVNYCFEDTGKFRMLIPTRRGKPGYILVTDDDSDKDSIASIVESRLSENPHYAYARRIGQLQPLRILPLKDPLGIYLNSPLHAGARLGNIKVPSLCLKPAIFNGYMDNIA